MRKFVQILVLVLLVLFALYKFALMAHYNPHGLWDAWAMWNVKAKFLFFNNGNVFSPQLPHADYPLLLPFINSIAWRMIGDPSTFVPIIVSLFFSLLIIAVLYFSLLKLRSHTHAFVATAILIATPTFIKFHASQMADIPFVAFILATVAALAIYREQHRVIWLVIGGLCAGAALNTKNEGALFLVALIPFFIRPIRIRELTWFIVGILPFMIPYLIFKLLIAPQTDLFEYQTDPISKITDLTRYKMILEAYSEDWFIHLIALVPMTFFVFQWERVSIRLNWILLTSLILFSGYFTIYVLTPLSLDWHLSTSLARITFHQWPILIFGALLSLIPKQVEKS